jgi:hypothetical protein
MFRRFATIKVQPAAMKDNLNDWIQNNLFISFEEIETDNDTDKTANTIIKR